MSKIIIFSLIFGVVALVATVFIVASQQNPGVSVNTSQLAGTAFERSDDGAADGDFTLFYPGNYKQPFSFLAAGDFDNAESSTKVLELVNEQAQDNEFLLALGDLGYLTGDETEQGWCNYVTDIIGKDFPVQLIAGNHDSPEKLDGSILKYRECLPNKVDGLVGDYGIEYYYDYNYLARFIMISPDIAEFGASYTAGTKNYEWVKSAVEDARDQGIDWVFLGMHKNCISVGVKQCQIGEDLLNLAVSSGVDVVLQGHEHSYSRSHLLGLSEACPKIVAGTFNPDCVVSEGASFSKGEGTLIVITGAAGKSLRDINIKDTEIGYFDTWSGKNITPSYGVSAFTLTESTLTGSFLPATGTYTDSFSVE